MCERCGTPGAAFSGVAFLLLVGVLAYFVAQGCESPPPAPPQEASCVCTPADSVQCTVGNYAFNPANMSYMVSTAAGDTGLVFGSRRMVYVRVPMSALSEVILEAEARCLR